MAEPSPACTLALHHKWVREGGLDGVRLDGGAVCVVSVCLKCGLRREAITGDVRKADHGGVNGTTYISHDGHAEEWYDEWVFLANPVEGE